MTKETIIFLTLLSLMNLTQAMLESDFLTDNQTLVSKNFELGFFRLDNRSYLGIWYRKLPQRTYVWVANRDVPIFHSSGTLKFENKNLVLLNQQQDQIWSARTNSDTMLSSGNSAHLLDDGNFVLKNVANEVIWQSFDEPADTILPGMKLYTDQSRRLSSWKNPDDPSTGAFTLTVVEPRQFFSLSIGNVRETRYIAALWTGYTNIPGISDEDIRFSFHFKKSNSISRLTLSNKGFLQHFKWENTSQKWNLTWYAPKEKSEVFNVCGGYSYFDPVTSECICMEGFEPMVPNNNDDSYSFIRCQRKAKLTCHGDGFLRLPNALLPNIINAYSSPFGMENCKKACLAYCKCIAFAMVDIKDQRPICLSWKNTPDIGLNGSDIGLIDIKIEADGNSIVYYKVALSELGHLGEERNRRRKTILVTLPGISFLTLIIFILCLWKRKQKQNQARVTATNIVEMKGVVISKQKHISVLEKYGTADTEVTFKVELPLMDFETVHMATNMFSQSNKIGMGGFGCVYKGKLPDGQKIAVKRMTLNKRKKTNQGSTEFLTEVKVISEARHRNLVRLIGCCIEVDERILVYEYVENGSLSSVIFDKNQSHRLNWEMRVNIINGIARGLLYIHQDLPDVLIHRDLKLSNVLLDTNMTPKISDFGLARIFGREKTEDKTMKVAGTWGYMSPEYSKNGIFSTKSDVFSFGVMVLEMITGKNNSKFLDVDNNEDLIVYALRKYREGKELEMLDTSMRNNLPSSSTAPSAPEGQVRRCLHLGLLCVEARPELRPDMALVVRILESEIIDMPQPISPCYLYSEERTQRNYDNEINEVTITQLEPR